MNRVDLSRESSGSFEKSPGPATPTSPFKDGFDLTPTEHQYVQTYGVGLLQKFQGGEHSPFVDAIANGRTELAAAIHAVAVEENPEHSTTMAAQLHDYAKTLPANSRGQFFDAILAVNKDLHGQVLDGYHVSPNAGEEYKTGSLKKKIEIGQSVLAASPENPWVKEFKKSLPSTSAYYRNGNYHTPMDAVNQPTVTPFIKTMLDGQPALTYFLTKKVEEKEGPAGIAALAQEMMSYWNQAGISDGTREQVGMIFRSIDNPALQKEFDRRIGSRAVKVASQSRGRVD